MPQSQLGTAPLAVQPYPGFEMYDIHPGAFEINIVDSQGKHLADPATQPEKKMDEQTVTRSLRCALQSGDFEWLKVGLHTGVPFLILPKRIKVFLTEL